MTNFSFFGTKSEQKALKKKLKKEEQVILNKESASINLSKLCTYIREPQNLEKLTVEKNGEIDFSPFALKQFNATNTEHQAIIQLAVERYNNAYQPLFRWDIKMIASFTVGILALSLASLFPPLTLLLAVPALMYAGFSYGKRQAAHEKHAEALNELCFVYAWCLNDPKAKITPEGQTLQEARIAPENAFGAMDENVQNMLVTLNPMLNEEDVLALTRNDLEETFVSDREQAIDASGANQFDISLVYLLYGKEQGSPWQVFRGIFSMIGDALSSCARCFTPGTPEISVQANMR